MIFDAEKNDQLWAYVDSNWGAETSKRWKSRNGIKIRYNSSPIYVSNDLQKSTALSSTAAVYAALSDACRVIIRLRQVLQQMGVLQRHAAIFQENNGCIE